jgi:prepilin-type N-terminal cleavage/methylation domain-containing protein
VDDGSTSVSIEASLARASVVVLRDTYAPGWIAEVDGAAATIVRANGIHRAVAVPPGRHVIRFRYRPREFIEGLTLTVAALLLIAFQKFHWFENPRNPRNDRNQNLRNGRNLRNLRNPSGFTLLELMIVLAILAVLLTVAFTEYRGMQAKGNEASALASMRSISVAEWQYALTCGNTKYAATLEALGQPVPQTGHAFLSPDLAQPNGFEKSGYKFQLAAKPIDSAPPGCNGAPVAETYAATADPMQPGRTGKFFFGVNADRIVFVDEEKSFTGEMPESGNPGHGSEVK